MGAFLDKPRLQKYNEGSSGAGLRYGLSSMQGWRTEMEDSHSVFLGHPGLGENICWFAVFDGHAGSRVSTECASKLIDCLTADDSLIEILEQESFSGAEIFHQHIVQCLQRGFLEMDDKLRRIPEIENGEDKSGTTCVCVLITEFSIVFCNCGDSRGVLCRDRRPFLSTVDHKPSNKIEHDRITAAGGSVMIDRVNGSLAVSRALGDFEYKNVLGRGPYEQLVVAQPDISIASRDPGADQFIVLACDGIWDVMSNVDVCEYIANRMEVCDDLEIIANEVIDCCLYKGSRDNMSIIIIAMSGSPQVSPASVEADKQLDTILKEKLDVLINEGEGEGDGDKSPLPFTEIFHRLFENLDELPNLPPGAGIYAKKSLLERHYNSVVQQDTMSVKGQKTPLANLLVSNANHQQQISSNSSTCSSSSSLSTSFDE